MAYFPNKTSIKTELQESTTQFDLSCVHLTSCNFGELTCAYIRHNTPRERISINTGVFARPEPLQQPVMGSAVLKLKNYYIPYRVLSPQWNDFITRAPHMPANGITPILVKEMPYFTAETIDNFINDTQISTIVTDDNYNYIRANGEKRKLTTFGRHCIKIFEQLGYKVVLGGGKEDHFNAMALLAWGKIYLDWYYSNQYAYLTAEAYEVEQLLKKDDTNAYELTSDDLWSIFRLTEMVWYSEDYFTSQWDLPTSPSMVSTSIGDISLLDITNNASYKQIVTNNQNSITSPTSNNASPNNGTPFVGGYTNQGNPGATYSSAGVLTQYALDSLKGLTDYVKRYQISVRSIDRYLARFGVLLTAEKMQRSSYNGEQVTNMNFGAIYSTAATETADVGSYKGQGIINSEGQEHNTFEYEALNEFGIIITTMYIVPKASYYQGIDRINLITDVESYFNGQWDNLGTQGTSNAELYVSEDGRSIYGGSAQLNAIFGYLPRQAYYKSAKDRLTGDFNDRTIAGSDEWHMFRKIDESQYNQTTNNMKHSPAFCQMVYDADQYLRIFNYQGNDSVNAFKVILQHAVKANIHAKPLYDSYDFEGNGKQIIMDGISSKHN